MSDASSRRQRGDWASRLPAVLGLAAMGLGVAGFLRASGETSFAAVFAACYATIQLFIFNVSVDSLSNWMLRAAAVAAPLATAGAALAVFGARVRQAALRWSLRRHPPDDLLVGGGNASRQLLRAIARRSGAGGGQRIVVLDKDGDCQVARDSGLLDEARFRLFEGNGTSPQDLAAVQALAARHVWIACGDDETNLGILATLLRELKESEGEGAGEFRHWYVEVDSPELLRHAVDFHQVPKGHRVELHHFSLERLLARRALQCHPADCAGRPHVAVVGASALAEAMVLQAVQQLVFSEHPAEALRVAWFGRGVDARRDDLLARHPALDARLGEHDPALAALLPVADLRVHEVDELGISPAAWRDAQAGLPFTAIFVAVEGGERLAVATQRVVALREYEGAGGGVAPPIVVCDADAGSPEPVMSRRLWGKPLDIAGMQHVDLLAVDLDGYPDSTNDGLAMKIHAFHRQSPDEAPAALWARTKEWERLSSRLAADHQRIKQALLRGASPQDGAMAERLARLEHRRFVVERLMGGWLPAPAHASPQRAGNSGLKFIGPDGRQGKDFLRLNPTLKPFDGLDEGSRAALRGQVARLLAVG